MNLHLCFLAAWFWSAPVRKEAAGSLDCLSRWSRKVWLQIHMGWLVCLLFFSAWKQKLFPTVFHPYKTKGTVRASRHSFSSTKWTKTLFLPSPQLFFVLCFHMPQLFFPVYYLAVPPKWSFECTMPLTSTERRKAEDLQNKTQRQQHQQNDVLPCSLPSYFF